MQDSLGARDVGCTASQANRATPSVAPWGAIYYRTDVDQCRAIATLWPTQYSTSAGSALFCSGATAAKSVVALTKVHGHSVAAAILYRHSLVASTSLLGASHSYILVLSG